MMRGYMADRAGIVDLEGAAVAIPPRQRGGAWRPVMVRYADVTVAPDSPQRAVNGLW